MWLQHRLARIPCQAHGTEFRNVPFSCSGSSIFVEYGGGGTRESQNCSHDVPQETEQISTAMIFGVFMFFVAVASRVLLKGLMIPLGR
jgi:hypothetical protein